MIGDLRIFKFTFFICHYPIAQITYQEPFHAIVAVKTELAGACLRPALLITPVIVNVRESLCFRFPGCTLAHGQDVAVKHIKVVPAQQVQLVNDGLH